MLSLSLSLSPPPASVMSTSRIRRVVLCGPWMCGEGDTIGFFSMYVYVLYVFGSGYFSGFFRLRIRFTVSALPIRM